MSSSPAWSRPLTAGQLWFICSAALALHILPLLMADMPVLDDYARQHMAYNDWYMVGRPLAVALFAGLGFGPDAVNLYPLPLLLAVVVTGRALAALACHWFETPTFSAVLVVLPLWFQPLFLQNLSYQYDGAPMALALSCSLWAITLGYRRRSRWGWGILLVAAAAAFYQPAVNVFAGLCGVEMIRQLIDQQPLAKVWRQACVRLVQLTLGCALYYLCCAWMVRGGRAGLLALDGAWLDAIQRRLRETWELIGLLLTPSVGWVAGAVTLLSVFAILRTALRLSRQPLGRVERTVSIALLPVCILIVLGSVPGLMLLLAVDDVTPRSLMGLGALLALSAYLGHEVLCATPRVRLFVLSVPLLFMLSFAYAYGRVVVLEKTLHQSIAQSLTQTLSSQASLGSARHYYLLDFRTLRPWIPAAQGTLQAMPAIGRILGPTYDTLPEMLPRMGIDDFHAFYDIAPLDRLEVLAASPVPHVHTRLYDIHVVGQDVYVLMNRSQRLPQDKP